MGQVSAFGEITNYGPSPTISVHQPVRLPFGSFNAPFANELPAFAVPGRRRRTIRPLDRGVFHGRLPMVVAVPIQNSNGCFSAKNRSPAPLIGIVAGVLVNFPSLSKICTLPGKYPLSVQSHTYISPSGSTATEVGYDSDPRPVPALPIWESHCPSPLNFCTL